MPFEKGVGSAQSGPAGSATQRLIRFALFAGGAHESDILPRQERLQAFQLLVQRLTSSILSYSPSVSDSDDRSDAGRNSVCCSRRWPPGSVRKRTRGGSRGRASCSSGSSDVPGRRAVLVSRWTWTVSRSCLCGLRLRSREGSWGGSPCRQGELLQNLHSVSR